MTLAAKLFPSLQVSLVPDPASLLHCPRKKPRSRRSKSTKLPRRFNRGIGFQLSRCVGEISPG